MKTDFLIMYRILQELQKASTSNHVSPFVLEKIRRKVAIPFRDAGIGKALLKYPSRIEFRELVEDMVERGYLRNIGRNSDDFWYHRYEGTSKSYLIDIQYRNDERFINTFHRKVA